MSNRFLASVFAGTVAFMVALDAGLPVWRRLPIGDATDFGVTTALFVWFALKAIVDTHRMAETENTGSVRSMSGDGAGTAIAQPPEQP